MMHSMKIVSWNLGAAYGRWRDEPDLHERAWHWLAEADPDIALLQETRPPVWAEENWAVIHGSYQSFASAILGPRDWELIAMELEPASALQRFGSYLATAEWRRANEDPLIIASVHTAARLAPEWGHPGFERCAIGRRAVGEPWWNDVAFAGYKRLVCDRRFLIGGDWNTARYVDREGKASPEGAEFFDRAREAGWFELSVDPQQQEGKSWYGSANPRPYQPDHVFADKATAKSLRRFTIDPVPARLGLSDHAPLIIDLTV